MRKVNNTALACLFVFILVMGGTACLNFLHSEARIADEVVVEGADYNSTSLLLPSPDLNFSVSPRVLVEYGEFIVKNNLSDPNIPPIPLVRVITEYAESTYRLALGLQVPTPPSPAPRIILEYVDYEFKIGLCRKIVCDVNYDGDVDIVDIALVAKPFETRRSDNPDLWETQQIWRYDVNPDEVINIVDLTIVAKYFESAGC